MSVWTVLLRQTDREVQAVEFWSVAELVRSGDAIDRQTRANPEMRVINLRVPNGTRREQLVEAFEQHLTPDERFKLYSIFARAVGQY